MVKVVPVDSPASIRRMGFMKGEIEIPEDFDRMGQKEIAQMFGIDE